MTACVIIHNMIVESEHDAPVVDDPPYDSHGPLAQFDDEVPSEFDNFLAMHAEIRDELTHTKPQYDLGEHPWSRGGLRSISVGFNLISITA